MVNVTQYPDILTYTKVSGGGSHQDPDGNVIIDEPTTEEVSVKCRAEANTSGRYINGQDGDQILYDWKIYIFKPRSGSIPNIPAGTQISVTRKGAIRATGQIKRMVVNQLNATAWV